FMRSIGYSEGWIPSAVLTANYKVTGTLPAPEFNYPSGLYGNVSGTEYEDGLKITLAVDEEYSNVSIYYTTDGSDSTQDSTLFTDPIRVPDLAQGFTIRARAFKPDWISSAISEEAYSYLLLPLNVRTITYEGYVRVLWSNPNARGLDGFNVYRKAANESAYRKLNDELVPVGQTIGGEHYYDDYEISNNMSYQYYVTAVYDGVESEDSGVTSAEYQTSELDVTENTRAYPNPAENSTTFQIKLSRNDNVQITISIFDFAGKKVRTLTGANLNTNLVEIPWDLKTDSGAKVGRGTYFARIQASDSAKRSEKVIKISVK
ncbi:MAG TPA: chitobiase/beta-hexosaminidase C-terminal domain-containing protein, partial [Candidatus Cloacimonadota bacterium]|nr:chitobiase/beta-hexosaminidase C-terminal domain-containing protein [Candidatus Cloacimonadota bacterium]